MFHTPFAGPVPPYPYTLDATHDVPGLVTNHAGVGKIGFVLWQAEHFTPAQLADTGVSGAGADPDGDLLSNYEEFLAGTLPLEVASAVRMISLARQRDDLIVTWATAGPRTNVLQAGDSPSAFADAFGPVVIPVPGDAVTNLVLPGEATNPAPRYYRVRVIP